MYKKEELMLLDLKTLFSIKNDLDGFVEKFSNRIIDLETQIKEIEHYASIIGEDIDDNKVVYNARSSIMKLGKEIEKINAILVEINRVILVKQNKLLFG